MGLSEVFHSWAMQAFPNERWEQYSLRLRSKLFQLIFNSNNYFLFIEGITPFLTMGVGGGMWG